MDIAAYQVVYELEKSHWFFAGRRNIISLLIEGYVQQDGLSILDVGCGTGATMSLLRGYGNVIGIDVSREAIKFCRQRSHTALCQADACCIPFPESSFDFLTALDLIEHLEDDLVGLREFSRVLKENGCLLLSVPAFMFLWSDVDVFSRHYRRYTTNDLKRKMEEAGFVILKLSYCEYVSLSCRLGSTNF